MDAFLTHYIDHRSLRCRLPLLVPFKLLEQPLYHIFGGPWPHGIVQQRHHLSQPPQVLGGLDERPRSRKAFPCLYQGCPVVAGHLGPKKGRFSVKLPFYEWQVYSRLAMSLRNKLASPYYYSY